MPTSLPDLKKIRGENATMTVDGLPILVDGDIELFFEQGVYEWKPRNVAITQHIISGRQTVSGSISGVPTEGIRAVLDKYMGVAKLDGTTELSDISISPLSITFTFTDSDDVVTLREVYLKNLKISAKDGEVIRIEADFVANAVD